MKNPYYRLRKSDLRTKNDANYSASCDTTIRKKTTNKIEAVQLIKNMLRIVTKATENIPRYKQPFCGTQ
jgi:hypothetical protein